MADLLLLYNPGSRIAADAVSAAAANGGQTVATASLREAPRALAEERPSVVVMLLGDTAARADLASAVVARAMEFARHSQPERSAAGAHRRGADEGRHLTPREREVLQLLASGYRARDIAGRLAISEETVKSHSANIRRKLGARTLAEAVWASRTELVTAALSSG